MVCHEDIEHIPLPPSSARRFDYLLAVCKFEQERLRREKDDDDHYYLRDAITNVLDERPSTSEPASKVTMKETDVILPSSSEKRRRGIVIEENKSGSNTPESNVSSPGDGAEAVPELNLSSRRKRSRNDAMAAEMMINSSNKRNVGGRNNVPNNAPEPPPGLPVEFKNFIHQLAGNRTVSVEKLVIQKELTDTDVSDGHNRLSIPIKHINQTFLTDEEEVLLTTRAGKKVYSMDVQFITPMMEVAKVHLRRWVMMKKSGPPSISYVISNTWNKIKEDNGLVSGMIVQLWAIRIGGDLWLPLVRVA